MDQNLEIDIAGRIATLWMNRPAMHNAFDAALVGELARAVKALDHDPAVRVLVLAGRGPSFSAGADLNWMREAAVRGVDENLRDAQALAGMLRAIADSKKPTLARIHGAALGGGMGLAAACDIAVASTAAVFAASEVRIGLIPATIGPYVLRAIGARQAQRLFLTGERIDAERARDIGLVHEVVAPAALDARVGEIAATLLAGGPAAQAAAKDLIRVVAQQAMNQSLIDETAHRIAHLRTTPEAREGMAAFLEKRLPGWAAGK